MKRSTVKSSKARSQGKVAENPSTNIHSRRRVVLKVGYLFSLAVLTFGAYQLLFGEVGVGGFYFDLLRWLYLPAYVLVAPALIMLVGERRLNSTHRFVAKALTFIVVLMLTWLLVGVVQDGLGIQCTSFFSAPTKCVELQYLLWAIWAFNPYVLLPLIGLTLLLLAKGWFDYYEDRG